MPETASLGKSIVVNGTLSGREDLTVEGQVDGQIELGDHVLTVGPNGRITAKVAARVIIVLGRVTGNLIASDKVDIRESGSVEGDIVAPRVAIADGSHVRGRIDMPRTTLSSATDRSAGALKSETKAPSAPAPVTGELVRV
jgi:cytoskeletal protein CcmA (bactofilin family)